MDHTIELIIGMEDLNRHVGRNIDVVLGFHGGFSIGEKSEKGRMLSDFYDAKHLCIVNTWLRKVDKKEITKARSIFV